MTDLQLTLPGELARDRPPPDRCESCGTPVTLLDPIALVRAITGLPEQEQHPDWLEYRVTPGDGESAIQLRPHSGDRCRAVRAGQPEPWSDPDAWDDGE